MSFKLKILPIKMSYQGFNVLQYQRVRIVQLIQSDVDH